MEDGAVEELVVDVFLEIGHRDRRLFLEELDLEIAQCGFEENHVVSYDDDADVA